MNSAEPPRPLTWGVEFEFLVMSYDSKRDDPDPSNPAPGIPRRREDLEPPQKRGAEQWTLLDIQAQIAETLRQNGINAMTNMDRMKARYNHNHMIPDSAWLVDTDETIDMEHTRETRRQRAEGGAFWYGIELISPPMYYSEESFIRLEKVCNIMSSNYRIIVNRTCGFHVHIGDGIAGFSMDTLKKLMAFLWIFESQLEKIHPRHRKHNRFCPSLWKSIHEDFYNPSRGDFETRKQGLERILRATTVNEVVGFFTAGLNRPAYNLSNLESTVSTSKKTIEFRMHEGVDLSYSAKVLHWLRVCEGLVRFAREKPLDEVQDYLRMMSESPNVQEAIQCSEYAPGTTNNLTGGTIDILMQLGLSSEATYYSTRLQQRLSKSKTDQNSMGNGPYDCMNVKSLGDELGNVMNEDDENDEDDEEEEEDELEIFDEA